MWLLHRRYGLGSHTRAFQSSNSGAIVSMGLRELEPCVVQSQVAECGDGVGCDL